MLPGELLFPDFFSSIFICTFMVELSADGLACLTMLAMENARWQLNLFVPRPPINFSWKEASSALVLQLRNLATGPGACACTWALTFPHPQSCTCVLGYLSSDSHFWFFSEVDFQLSFPELLAPWYKNCIRNKDSPNRPLVCITEGHASLFPWGLCSFVCRSKGRFWVRL